MDSLTETRKMRWPVCCSDKVKRVISSLYFIMGITIGLIICVVFNVPFQNRSAAYFGLVSSVFAFFCLVQDVYYHKQKNKISRLGMLVFFLIGIIGMAGGLGALVIFFGLGIKDAIDHVRVDRMHFITAVWSFVTFKWGVIAFRKAYKAELIGTPLPVNS